MLNSGATTAELVVTFKTGLTSEDSKSMYVPSQVQVCCLEWRQFIMLVTSYQGQSNQYNIYLLH